MYRKEDRNQLRIEEFFLPFGGQLSSDNRWVREAAFIPWDLVEDIYERKFKDENPDGRPPIPARIAYGAIYIKEHENLTDERTVESITENPYMQYFLGYQSFQTKQPFTSSMMTLFRKRFTAKDLEKINEEMFHRTHPPKNDPPEDTPPKTQNEKNDEESENSGTLVLDATAAPADIRYPTDLSLLNECRENTERMIDELWTHSSRNGHKTSYSRKKAWKNYLKIQKQRKARKKVRMNAVKEQLEYAEANIKTIEKLLKETGEKHLTSKRAIRLRTIREVCKQQREMMELKKNSCADRIVSLRQPHVRPIVRGKAGNPTEFGQKLAFSVVDGYTFIEVQSWDNFAEGVTLQESAEKYRKRHGCYPKAILADKTYRNKDNLNFCRANGIRLSGPRLGRPKVSEIEQDKAQAYQDNCARNIVESRNGIVKRRYGMDRIMSWLSCTGETEAALKVFAMNVAHCVRILLCLFFLREIMRRKGEHRSHTLLFAGF